MEKKVDDRDTKYYIEAICHQLPDLQIFYITEYVLVIYCMKNWMKFFRNQIGLLFQFETYNYSISLALNCFCLLYHSLLFAFTPCHLLALIVPLVVIRFTDRCNSFLVVAIRWHSLYHSLSLVVTRCTSPLVFSIFFVCLFFLFFVYKT